MIEESDKSSSVLPEQNSKYMHVIGIKGHKNDEIGSLMNSETDKIMMAKKKEQKETNNIMALKEAKCQEKFPK